VVAFVATRLVKIAVTALRSVAKKLEEVAEETDRLSDTRLEDTVRLVVDALVKVVCPVTASVPLDVNEEVAVTDEKVEDPPVREEIADETEEKIVAKRFDDVVVARAVLPVKVLLPVND
jgi:hypothetical protein